MPISHDEELTIDDLVEMLKQSALEEAEPQPKDRTVTALKLTERLGLTAAGVKVFED